MDCTTLHARATTILCGMLAFTSLVSFPLALQAGKMSAVRGAVRNEEASNDNDQEEGKLEKARNRARQSSSRRSRDHHGHGHHHHGHASYLSISPIFIDTTCEPAPVYHSVVPEARYEAFDPLELGFPRFPYADGAKGGMLDHGFPIEVRDWSARARFETGNDGDGLSRRAAGFLLEGSQGLGVDFQWNSYSEEIGTSGHDELHIGEVNVLYRLAQSEHSQWRVGIGVGWLGDAAAADAGINFTLKGDIYPVKPIVLSGEIDLGTLGDAETFHGAASAGVMLNRFEFFGGYDYRNIGGAELDGPMIGVRIWF